MKIHVKGFHEIKAGTTYNCCTNITVLVIAINQLKEFCLKLFPLIQYRKIHMIEGGCKIFKYNKGVEYAA